MRRQFFAVCLTAVLVFTASAVQAQTPAPAKDESSNCSRLWEFLQYNCEGAANAWDGNDWDLYLPGYVHHGHGTYSPEKLATLNSSAWGGGIGKR